MTDRGADPVPAWAVVVPVKDRATAKSRLALPSPLRAAVARAMAVDTVRAAASCPLVARVVVVTDEDPADFAGPRVTVVPDVPRAGLNAALRHGAAFATDSAGGAGNRPHPGGLAALAADLPALRAPDLTRVLGLLTAGERAAVADTSGAGTTLLAAAGAAAALGLRPRFGVGSFRRHLQDGARDVSTGAGARLRSDVDSLDDLAAAVALGVGPQTAALLGDLQPWLPA